MDYRSSKKSVQVCVLLSLLAVLPVSAQSSTDSSKSSDISPKDSPILSHDAVLPESLRPPAGLFNSGGPRLPFDILPGSSAPQIISPQESMQMQKLLDDRKNWTLLTPEEILGVPTPEKILGVPMTDDQKNLTATERYMRRMDENSHPISATNAVQGSWLSLDSTQNDLTGSRLNSSKLGAFNNRIWNQNENISSQDVPAAKPVSIWASAFTQPPVAPKADPEQVASMERFRVLLGSVTPPTPILTTLPNQPIAPVVDPNLQVMPEVNPMGGSFTPLKDTSSKPMGIIPLPGIATRPLPVSHKVDPAAPKLPPWMTHQIPVPGTQQRVF